MDSTYSKFRKQGYAVIENFLSENDAEILKKEMKKLVHDMNPYEHRTVFKTGDSQVGDDYFMTSGDKIRYFFEEKSFNERGELIVSKQQALNKVGHALHWLHPDFKRVTFNEKVKSVAKNLGLIEPKVAMSMYIFKHPEVASEVPPHQDATFLYTSPQNLIGFWIALEDATIENGCLWFIPESHKGPLARRMVRSLDGKGIKYTSSDPHYPKEQFVPVPVKKGSLVLIHGLAVHKSGINSTDQSRDIYTFHIIESHKTDYSSENWLLPTVELPFPPLYSTNSL